MGKQNKYGGWSADGGLGRFERLFSCLPVLAKRVIKSLNNISKREDVVNRDCSVSVRRSGKKFLKLSPLAASLRTLSSFDSEFFTLNCRCRLTHKKC